MKKKRTGSSSIVFRLRIAFLVPFLAFLGIVIVILGFQYRNRSKNDIISQLRYEDEILAQSLEARISNAQSSVNAAIINLNQMIPDSKLNNYQGPDNDAAMRRLIYDCMTNAFTTFYKSEQVLIVWNNGVAWYENWTENFTMQDGQEALLEEMRGLEIDNSGKWLRRVESSPIAGTGYYFAKRYVDIDTGIPLGYVILKERDIFESIRDSGEERSLYLFDPNGTLISSSDSEMLAALDACESAAEMLEYSEQLADSLLETGSDRTPEVNSIPVFRRWRLISVTDMRIALRELNRLIALITAATVGVLIITYLIVCKLIDQIIHPIRALSEHMANSSGSLPAPLDLKVRNDEVGVLVTSFNEMTDRNQQLLDMLLEEKKQQEQLKFSLLQSQIKPHFLYNTLDTIYCLVLMGRNEESGKMTKLLSDYYRHVLSRGMDWVLLYEEIQQTENYLKIQSIRYQDILDYEILVDENVENVSIPKLTLQPLVENAIYHGIKPLGRKGHLQLKISQKKQWLYIRVIDDGVGMTEQRLREALEHDHSTKDGFGLHNVIERLNFYYGQKCRIRLENCSEGTRLLVVIPVSQESV